MKKLVIITMVLLTLGLLANEIRRSLDGFMDTRDWETVLSAQYELSEDELPACTVTAGGTVLRAGPGEEYAALAGLAAGETLWLTSFEREGWHSAETMDGVMRGWVALSACEVER